MYNITRNRFRNNTLPNASRLQRALVPAAPGTRADLGGAHGGINAPIAQYSDPDLYYAANSDVYDTADSDFQSTYNTASEASEAYHTGEERNESIPRYLRDYFSSSGSELPVRRLRRRSADRSRELRSREKRERRDRRSKERRSKERRRARRKERRSREKLYEKPQRQVVDSDDYSSDSDSSCRRTLKKSYTTLPNGVTLQINLITV
jgi:hypothetical protein